MGEAIEAAGLSFILGMRIPDIPWVLSDWHEEHPGGEVSDGQVFTQPWPAANETASSWKYSQVKWWGCHCGCQRSLNRRAHVIQCSWACRRTISVPR